MLVLGIDEQEEIHLEVNGVVTIVRARKAKHGKWKIAFDAPREVQISRKKKETGK